MVEIIKAKITDLEMIHKMQVESFLSLLEKYKDYELSPACETLERIVEKYNQVFTTYWLIKNDKDIVGAFRIVRLKDKVYRISPIFILPSSQGRGIGQEVFNLIEKEYEDADRFVLATILEEKRNCYFYEKLGYETTGEIKKIKDGMNIVYYEKNML